VPGGAVGGRRRRASALDEVAAATGLSTYAARVLLEAGLGMRIVWRRDERFHLGKVGHFLLNDEMTRVNFDFSRDVCYAAAARLDEALASGRPSGLASLGPWPTLYEGLSALPEPARRSWFAFDHFYSDRPSRWCASGSPRRHRRACSTSAATPASGRACASSACRR
jgi:hypothetical protein